MSEDAAYVELSRSKEYHCNDPVVIALHVEYVTVVTNVICSWEISFECIKISPFRLLYLLCPGCQFLTGLSVLEYVLADSAEADEVHCGKAL